MFAKEDEGMDTVSQSTSDCKGRLVCCLAFAGSPTWQTSCRDGLVELNLLRVPERRGLQADCRVDVGVRVLLVSWIGDLHPFAVRFN